VAFLNKIKLIIIKITNNIRIIFIVKIAKIYFKVKIEIVVYNNDKNILCSNLLFSIANNKNKLSKVKKTRMVGSLFDNVINVIKMILNKNDLRR
jgi:hypothetical protein